MKIIIVTNILTPYRKAFFDELARQCRERSVGFRVFAMASGIYGQKWKYEEYASWYTTLLNSKTIRIRNIEVYLGSNLKNLLKEDFPDIAIFGGSYVHPAVWRGTDFLHRQSCEILYWSESHLDEERTYPKGLLYLREYMRRKFYKKFLGFWYPGAKARQLIEKYATKEALYIEIPNLIDSKKFSAGLRNAQDGKEAVRRKYGLDPDKYIMFSPMRLAWVKGLEPFMELAAESSVKEKLQLAVAGTGELEKHLRDKAEQLEVDLILLGYHEEDEIIELYNAADCFFMPSLSDASPLSCIEAVWSGLPLFVSNHVGNALETVEQGINGYIFSYKDRRRAISDLENMILSDEAWRERARAKSREIAENRFDLEKATEVLLDRMMYVERMIKMQAEKRAKNSLQGENTRGGI